MNQAQDGRPPPRVHASNNNRPADRIRLTEQRAPAPRPTRMADTRRTNSQSRRWHADVWQVGVDLQIRLTHTRAIALGYRAGRRGLGSRTSPSMS